jgi:hypothetical protein
VFVGGGARGANRAGRVAAAPLDADFVRRIRIASLSAAVVQSPGPIPNSCRRWAGLAVLQKVSENQLRCARSQLRWVASNNCFERSLEFTEAPLTPHEILAVCSRLAALIWGTFAIHRVPELFVHIDYPTIDNRASVLVLTAIQLGMCLFLWFFSGTVARKLLPLKDVAASSSPRLMDWQILGRSHWRMGIG